MALIQPLSPVAWGVPFTKTCPTAYLGAWKHGHRGQSVHGEFPTQVGFSDFTTDFILLWFLLSFGTFWAFVVVGDRTCGMWLIL